MCTVATLRRLAERLNTPGRPWVRRFLGLTVGWRAAARSPSWERRVHDGLVKRGVHDL